jgi:hypothetical protein
MGQAVDYLTVENGTDRSSRKIGDKLQIYDSKTPQENENLIYTTAEALNHAKYLLFLILDKVLIYPRYL